MAEWPVMTLREAGVELIDCVHETPAALSVGFPYVAIPQMKNGRIDFSTARRISESDFIKWTRKARPQLHDVVLSRRTNPGVTATFGSECDFALGQNLVLLRADGTVVRPEFLRWLVTSPAWWEQIRKYNNVGAVFDSLRCADVPRFQLPIPPKHHQKEIASLLAALDDKIELNRRMNDTLEAMARAMFEDWFVDFGPTRAKMDRREPYLAPDAWSLFPEQLDDETKPVGWDLVPAYEMIDFNPSERLTVGQTAPYLDMAALPTLGSWPDIPISRHFSSGSKFRNGDAILARITPCLENGKAAFIQNLGDDNIGWGSTEFIVMRARPPMPSAYAYIVARYTAFKDRAVQSMTGTSGRQRVQVDSLAEFALARPPQEVAKAFGAFVSPWFAKIAANARESQTLDATRDLLLPTLLSGEIRLKDAEKRAEAAL